MAALTSLSRASSNPRVARAGGKLPACTGRGRPVSGGSSRRRSSRACPGRASSSLGGRSLTELNMLCAYSCCWGDCTRDGERLGKLKDYMYKGGKSMCRYVQGLPRSLIMFRGGKKKAYHTPPWKPEISQADLPTYLSQPEVVQRVSKRAEMNGTARGRAPIGFNCFKSIFGKTRK